MSAPTGPTPAESQAAPEDPEAVVDEAAEPSGEDYDPADRIDRSREASEADMIDQAAEVRLDEDELGDSGDD